VGGIYSRKERPQGVVPHKGPKGGFKIPKKFRQGGPIGNQKGEVKKKKWKAAKLENL